jgi:hypothetical protein
MKTDFPFLTQDATKRLFAAIAPFPYPIEVQP